MINVPPDIVFDEGACTHPDVDMAWFFPDRYDSKGTAPAREVCNRCPARVECETWARKQGPELDGIWAGTTPADRGKRGRRRATRSSTPGILDRYDPRHGTENGYTKYGCRCVPCKRAHAEAKAARNERRAPLAPDDPRHGTTSGYDAGCRGEACRAAWAEYRADHRQRQRMSA